MIAKKTGTISKHALGAPICPGDSVKASFDNGERLWVDIYDWDGGNRYYGREGEPIALGRKFVGSWCGVSEDKARESMKYLPKHCTHTAGKHGPANIYLPGYEPPQQPKGRIER